MSSRRKRQQSVSGAYKRKPFFTSR